MFVHGFQFLIHLYFCFLAETAITEHGNNDNDNINNKLHKTSKSCMEDCVKIFGLLSLMFCLLK